VTSPAPAPSRSFRQIPPAIYIALAAHVAGAIVLVIATWLASDNDTENILALRRWQLLYQGSNVVSAILLAIGLAQLAQRLTGRARVLTRIGAYLGLASLFWIATRPLLAVLDPSFERTQLFYKCTSLVVSLVLVASAVLLTLGADAWRRAPVAAVLLVALYVTSYGIPVIGPAIADAFGTGPLPQQLQGLARLTLHTIALLPIAAALAARGRTPAPEPRVAAAGLRLARGVLLFRIAAACVISVTLVGGRSPGAAKIVQLGGPVIIAITMLVLAIALLRAAGARVEGMPPAHLSLGAALALWWGTIQLEQASLLVQAMHDRYPREAALAASQWFSIAGPLAAALGLAVVGSAIAALARSRGDHPLRDAATSRTTFFLVVTLASIGLGALIGLLDRGAEAITAEPELPPARLV
jgi:hypothetical protein